MKEKYVKVPMNVVTESGCYFNTAITIREDYGMSELVRELKERNIVMFKTNTMKKLVKI